MNHFVDNEDTIVAVSTPPVESAISIIRLSGKEAIKVVDKIYKGKNSLDLCKSNTINYGHIYDGKEIVDEVLVSVFRAPKTYTKENIVEINTHGGMVVTNKVLKLILGLGVREANPGEFTQRAFINGRIDLVQAEATLDLIKAENDYVSKLAINLVKGDFTNYINNIRDRIINILGNLEVRIDYPEYTEIEDIQRKDIISEIESIVNDITKILENKKNSFYLRNGISVVIVGRPNVGKSTLLNFLLNEDKAIVTDVEGTTRDIVEGTLLLKDIKVNISDTAGLRDTKDVVETIGIEKTYKEIDKANLIIYMIDADKIIEEEEIRTLETISKEHKILILINKIEKNEGYKVDPRIKKFKILKVSLQEKINIDSITKKIIDLLQLDFTNTTGFYLINKRHISLLEYTITNLKQALASLNEGIEEDLITIDLKEAYQNLGYILGKDLEDDLLDNIFSRFCLGK